MTHRPCRMCKRIIEGECPHCQDPAITQSQRACNGLGFSRWADHALATCVKCPHWTRKKSTAGCGLIPIIEPSHKPCDIGYFIRKGRGCFDDPPRFDPRPSHTFPEFKWDGRGGERCIVTVIVGDKAEELAEFTLPLIEKYAEKTDAELVIHREDLYPEWPMANKFIAGPISAKFDRTFFVDIDAWVRESAPDIFKTFPSGHIYKHRDQEYLEHGHLESDAVILGEPGACQHCWNSGIVLQDREHAFMWTPPKEVEMLTHTLEQSSNEINLKRAGVEPKRLPSIWNNQWWTRDHFWGLYDSAHIIHLAGCNHEERIRLLERLKAEEDKKLRS